MADLRSQLQAGLSGSYALERALGRGGRATVFLARNLEHDRPVALKVLHHDPLRSNPRFRRPVEGTA